jgi:hypothetical protein
MVETTSIIVSIALKSKAHRKSKACGKALFAAPPRPAPAFAQA